MMIPGAVRWSFAKTVSSTNRAIDLWDSTNHSPAERTSEKYSRTLVTTCRSVILSTVSTAATRTPGFFFASRFFSSPFASPGRNHAVVVDIKLSGERPLAAVVRRNLPRFVGPLEGRIP